MSEIVSATVSDDEYKVLLVRVNKLRTSMSNYLRSAMKLPPARKPGRPRKTAKRG